LINYQGVLKDSLGMPYNGNATMVFSIWNDSTDGNKLWEETQAIVSVSHGLFNILLGSSVPIPYSAFAQPNCWLQVIANGSLLSPRRRIVSVGYALHSEFSDTAKYALSAPPDNDWMIDTSGFNIFRTTGNVGIGTTNPTVRLAVNGVINTGGSNGAGDIGILDNNGNTLGDIYGAGSNPWLYIRSASGKALDWGTNGVQGKMVMDTLGNVGIGTNSPTAKLEVQSYGCEDCTVLKIGGYTSGGRQYIQIDVENYDPPASACDEYDEVGRMVLRGDTNQLFICTGYPTIGWKRLTAQ
jgi:hypothetical protein